MSRRILEYKVIKEEYDGTMTTRVNRMMGEGWELYGPPSVASSQYTTKIIQAMVMYETPRQQAERFGFRVTDDDGEPTDHFDEGDFALD